MSESGQVSGVGVDDAINHLPNVTDHVMTVANDITNFRANDKDDITSKVGVIVQNIKDNPTCGAVPASRYHSDIMISA